MIGQWNIISYDISDPRRLTRTHRLLRKKGVAVQRSVFLYHGTGRALLQLLEQLDDLIDAQHDDLRVYPVAHPARFWSTRKIIPSVPELNKAPQAKSGVARQLAHWLRTRRAG